MHAITLHQPWASLVAVGFKRYETRHWRTKVRGLIAIHAAQLCVRNVNAALERTCAELFGADWRAACPLGAVVATATLDDCLPTEDVDASTAERIAGDFRRGRFAWQLGNVRPVVPSVPARGGQGFWMWVAPAGFWVDGPHEART